ncbi:serine hydrolase domain-containing protein [Streptomyces muensis]|uniref:Beta-lactamase family protein n=1 Tax=Streptomyces muensis TaxID=1077944 RepID=A0A9X1Q0Q3_STRM4|nr:serine hydrolase domain-containing protein [Streptomyces muensis]MCF1595206.1 beta-lactamase family protein [Streptomyces muensis]
MTAGFEPVADAFADNFDHRGDTAASCVVYADGVPVVDIWAGKTGRGAWTPEIRNVVFSVSKGVTTICVLMAAERNLLDLDARVGEYWPDFAQHGKEATTVRHLLTHQAGLLAPEVDLSAQDLLAWQPVVDQLARQAPAWVPGTSFAYHPLTFGWLAGEVLRRATGQRPAEWLRDHVAAPLGLAMTFGALSDAEDMHPLLEALPISDPDAGAALAEMLAVPMAVRAMSLGGLFDAADMPQTANGTAFLAAEIPGANLVTNARSLARLYAATVGTVDGTRLLGADTVDDARLPRSTGRPFIGPADGNRWGTGFMLDSPLRGMAGPGSFGHDGLGGQLAFAHPESRIAFAYQTVRPGGIPDDRAEALCRALRACL